MNDNSEIHLLLQAITGNVREQLVEAAMASIRPAVVERVDAIVREMEPRLAQYRDLLADKFVLQFSVREPKA